MFIGSKPMGIDASFIILNIKKKIQDGGGGHFGFRKNGAKIGLVQNLNFFQTGF